MTPSPAAAYSYGDDSDSDSDAADHNDGDVVGEDDVVRALSSVLEGRDGVDDDLLRYLAGMVVEVVDDARDDDRRRDDVLVESLGPFLESSGCDEDDVSAAVAAASALYAGKRRSNDDDDDDGGGVRLLRGGGVSMAAAAAATTTTEAEEDAARYLWGKEEGGPNANAQREAHKGDALSAKELRKQRQELEKARRQYEHQRRANEEDDDGPSGMILPDYDSGRNEKDIQVRNVDISLDNGRALLEDATIKLSHRRRYGLVGKNGIGKTTLLKAVASFEIKDFPRHHRVLHVRQEVATGVAKPSDGDGDDGDDQKKKKEPTVLETVLAADVERTTLLNEERRLAARLERDEAERAKDDVDTFDADLAAAEAVRARLVVIGGDGAEGRAATILSGLQFDEAMRAGPVSALSGGWRMRVRLAAALFVQPDLLLLDEPTNHLDLEAVLWLESYLVKYKHTMVVVSHDRGFLNEVVTDVIEFKDKKLTYYKGDYDTYVRTSTEAVRNAARVYEAYKDKRAHMMEFIDKFRFNAKRASLVQSRIKAVEKMDAEAPDPVEVERLWRFSVPDPEPLGRPVVSIDDVSFDYDRDGNDKERWLLRKVNFGVDLDSRIGIMGANGAGKSTLLNLVMDRLSPLEGSVVRNGRLRTAYFTQHSADNFDLDRSALENMLAIYEGTLDQEMRSFLGRFQIQNADALKPMAMLSGGQKSRVAFARLAYRRPHVIVMDEPTNHLDMESIDALVEALRDFKGGLMVVSHDQYFITNTCRELWVVGDGEARRFRGDFAEYKKHTLERTAKRVAESVRNLSTMDN